MWKLEIPDGATPMGYRYLIEKFKLKVVPHYCYSYACPKFEKKKLLFESQNIELCLYPKSMKVAQYPLDHLVFALKNEGINLLIIKELIQKLSVEEVTQFIQKSPVGKYARKIWFLSLMP